MPNTPALVGAGVTGLYADPSVDTLGREEAERIMAAVGEVLWVEEEGKIDAITALSGSGPAYVFAFLEALQAAGEALGFDATTARRLAQATAAGAVRLAQESEEPLSRLRENVTSKGGTTEAALARLNERGFAEALREAVFAAYARSQELARQLGEAP
jgi:pyrroline-5-carboxylate reductase